MNLMTVKQYADGCGVSTTVIYRRVKLGKVKLTDSPISGVGLRVIDADQYPFVKAGKPTGRPKV